MNLKLAATISTTLVVVAGFAITSPMFFSPAEQEAKLEARQKVMLSFVVLPGNEATEWCNNLSSLLNSSNTGASVFISGKVAEENPEYLSYFSEKVDIGSQTYSNLDLTTIADYSLKLDEVYEGKKAVDRAGSLVSKAFRAPFGATDGDIYSLLSRSGITADFSYDNQYNVYQNGQFVKYVAATYKARNYSPDFFLTLTKTAIPLIIIFDSTDSISSIQTFLSVFRSDDFRVVNASEHTGLDLTTRLDRK